MNNDSSRVTWRTGSAPFGMIPEWVLTHQHLTAQAVRLYGVLARLASWETGTTLRGQTELADLMHVSVRTMQRAQTELERVDALTLTHQKNQMGQGWNLYELAWEASDIEATPGDTHAVAPGDTHDRPGGDTHVAPLQDPPTDHISREQEGGRPWLLDLQRQAQAATIPIDDYLQELVDLFGYRPTADQEIKHWAGICRLIQNAGDLPAEIKRRADTYRLVFPSAPLTPSALKNRWEYLGSPKAHEEVNRIIDTDPDTGFDRAAYEAALGRRTDGEH